MNDKTEAAGEAEPEAVPNTVNGRPCATVTFDEPVKRAGGDVSSVQIMRPRGGDLRGVSLMDLMQMQTDAVVKLLPRITHPTLHAHEVDALAPADLLNCAVEVVGFLLPKDAVEALPK